LTTRGRQREDATREDAETAVRRHGWLAVDRRFDSWPELDQFRVAIAEQTLRRFPDAPVEDYDHRAVEVILRQVERAGPARRMIAEKLLTDLLVRCRLVIQDDQLRTRIGQQLDILRRSAVVGDVSTTPLARERAQLDRLELGHGLDADAA
jgi:hypothetical protein